jgi:23S rRNA (guanosine2251-2'-O)-methyltransferase
VTSSESPDYYRFLSCQDSACQLRFPGAQGVLCPICKGPTEVVAERAAQPSTRPEPRPQDMALLLDNVRSVFNVGSIFRSADGCGIRQIYLGGITPTPAHSAMKKTALGAEHTIAWRQHNSSITLAEELLAAGCVLWALEYTEDSVELTRTSLVEKPAKLVLILGNEVTGVDPGLLALCQRTLHIPMRGQKVSLNVATAAGIAGYALCRATLG